MRGFLVLVIVCAASTTAAALHGNPFKYCCDLGTNHANNAQQCAAIKTPIAGVNKDDEMMCLTTLTICCKNELKKQDCAKGLQDAKSGECTAAAGTQRKDCCDACKFGKMFGESQQPCQNTLQLLAPFDAHFIACCEESSSPTSIAKITATTPTPKITSTVAYPVVDSKNDGLPPIGNMCDIEGLCAQICIPSEDSYKCDCNPGYSLMADRISCKEIKQKPAILERTDRCMTNNPCEHICTDTGTAVQCNCRDGYQLAKDKRSCNDIDECALNLHSCEETEICINGDGFYDCELTDYDDGDEAKYDIECPLGFRFNGEKKVCDDFDECETPFVCQSSQTCKNTIGSYVCEGADQICPSGFHYKESTQNCEDIDECVTGQNDCNRESQVCLNTKGNFTCIDKASKTKCPPGFKMNPFTQICEDINECLENPALCGTDEVCVNESGGHTCLPKSSNLKPIYTTKIETTTTAKTTPTTRTTVKTTPTTRSTPTTRTTPTTKTTTTTTTPKTTTTVTTKATTSKWEDPVYPTFNPSKPEPPTVRNVISFVTQPTEPYYYTTTTRKPAPAFVKPNSPTSCQRGFKYQHSTKECIDVDECLEDSQACDNYQDCYNTPGSYVCNCKIGFTKDPTTGACMDINECQVGSSDCMDGQRCDNTIGSYLCSRVAGCGTGYTLNYANGLCEDDDECLLGTHSCDKMGSSYICRNTYGSYRCDRPVNRWPSRPIVITRPINNFTIISGQSKKCLPGYYMDPAGNCQDINECESNPCTRGQKCINLRGRYQCISRMECKGGYELNEAGDGCVDINECTRGTHACSTTQICKNHIGYHVCLCPPGHTLVNNECVDINECEYYKNRICSSNSYCLNTIGSYSCKCKDGFREHGNSCIDVDECAEQSGLCQQKCVNNWGSYRCFCERGFVLDDNNRTCSDIDECEKFRDKDLCIGKCENTPGSYSCSCPAGYKLGSDGRTCQDIDECATQQPCQGRDMICFNTRGGYECPSIVCPPNYIRDPDHKSRCKRDPVKCGYIGTCSDTPEQYTYHFFNLASKLPMVNGPIKFFQMKGPQWDASTAKFNLKVENVNCPRYLKKVDSGYFRVNRQPQKADISFVLPIEGPQQIELSFEMQLFNNNFFSGRVVAKIFIYVSEYSF